MSLYVLRISHGPGASDLPYEFTDRETAWAEMTAVCADLLGGIARGLEQGDEWRMELIDESRKPIFRIRLLGETLG